MNNLSFKLWLEGMEEYEPFRKDVEYRVSGQTREEHFPFESWWPVGQDRVFIPMSNFAKSEGEEQVVDFLKDFKGVPTKGLPESKNGYELVDYKAGLARPIGGKNSYRIMKIINGALEDEIKELNDEKASEQMSELAFQNKLKYIKKYYDELSNLFQNDPARASGTQFYTVISKNPHDLASMSTGRGWTSCMNLATGSNKATVWCELKNGGFVAYLIRANDKDIQKPLARILIRRFDRRKKSTREIQSVAVPEDVVYGLDNPDFVKYVKDWLRSKQGEVIGKYYRRGGEYSDTFSGRKQSLFTYEINQDNINKLLNKYLNSSIKFKKSGSGVQFKEKLKEAILNDKSIVLDQDTKKLLFGSMFPSMYDRVTDNLFYPNAAGDYSELPKFLIRFPDMYRDGVVKKYIEKYQIDKKRGEGNRVYDDKISDLLIQLYRKHPEFFDDEDLQKFNLKIGRSYIDIEELSPKALEKYREKVKNESEQKLNVDRFDLDYKEQVEYYKFHEDLYGFIEKALPIFKPLPPEIVRQLVTLWNNRNKLHELWKDDKNAQSSKYEIEQIDPKETKTRVSYDLASKIMHLFNMTDTDIPLALNWVDEVIRIKGLLSYRSYGYYLAKLGYDNGKRFLPFLYKQKEDYEKKLAKASNKDEVQNQTLNVENLNYIIDSIETGKNSKKYVFGMT